MTGPEIGTHLQLAVSENEAVEESAMKQAHDAILEKLPERFIRTTGVTWNTYEREAGIRIVEKLAQVAVEDEPRQDVVERLREWPQSVLVVAWVEGVDPENGPCLSTCPDAIKLAYRTMGFKVSVQRDYPKNEKFPPVRYVCGDRTEWWIDLIQRIEIPRKEGVQDPGGASS